MTWEVQVREVSMRFCRRAGAKVEWFQYGPGHPESGTEARRAAAAVWFVGGGYRGCAEVKRGVKGLVAALNWPTGQSRKTTTFILEDLDS